MAGVALFLRGSVRTAELQGRAAVSLVLKQAKGRFPRTELVWKEDAESPTSPSALSFDGVKCLIIIAGQEGAGKTTIVRSLLSYLQPGALIDAEEVGQANPWRRDDAFKNLLWDNADI